MAPCPYSLSYRKWPPLCCCRPSALRLPRSSQAPFWRQRAESRQPLRGREKRGDGAENLSYCISPLDCWK
ncbi:hypothetical protein GJAV_G00108030 [Gymnothorax javanicus]|nr:hypothetical protein GJAV_G00108030 [Gymnothorax javanicus]